MQLWLPGEQSKAWRPGQCCQPLQSSIRPEGGVHVPSLVLSPGLLHNPSLPQC